MTKNLTLQQRFHRGKPGEAPLTIGTPAFLHSIDRSVFEKSKAEKAIANSNKKDHKADVRKAYGDDYRRQLNTPIKSLDAPIKLVF